jgi:hypothetical protein
VIPATPPFPRGLEDLLRADPFGLPAPQKRELYRRALGDLTRHHWERSPEFRRVASLFGYRPEEERAVEDLPYVPVRLFKEFELRSVESKEIVKTLTSSGTTGQAVSHIFLDRTTAANQTRVLVRIVASFTGPKRLPFLIVDTPSVVKDRALFSARGAGILGFAMLGHDPTYLLDEEYRIDEARLAAFQERHRGAKVLAFGFTSIVWEYLCQALRRAGRRLDLDGILMHGGGWKKLAAQSVDNDTFKRTVRETTGISTVCNYYGMVEQTGSIFMECPEGALHASVFSDVIVRDPATFQVLGAGQAGLVQLISLLPTSYPGHSILTEDLGEILGVDDCACGRLGTRFRIHGRVKNAEVRGCSDTHAPAP